MSCGIVQKVFEDISLLHNVPLWLSEDDDKFEERIQFLATYEEVKFKEVFNKDLAAFKKNDKIAAAFR